MKPFALREFHNLKDTISVQTTVNTRPLHQTFSYTSYIPVLGFVRGKVPESNFERGTNLTSLNILIVYPLLFHVDSRTLPRYCQNTNTLQNSHTHTHTLQNRHIHTPTHITKQVKTITVQDTHQMK